MLERETGQLEASMKLWSLEANNDGVPVYVSVSPPIYLR
jgi:hypothetical protein